jgi:hypothetical protein
MADHDIETVLGWRGRSVLDRDGEKVGTFGEVYLDHETDRPAFAGVNTGLFGRNEHIIPLAGVTPAGDDLKVPYRREEVHEAPQVDADVALEPEQEAAILDHYEEEPSVRAGGEDDAPEVVRSEEEVEFSTRPTTRRERIRLRKVVVTDEVEKTVPVRREEVRVEHDPPPEGRIISSEDAGPA